MTYSLTNARFEILNPNQFDFQELKKILFKGYERNAKSFRNEVPCFYDFTEGDDDVEQMVHQKIILMKIYGEVVESFETEEEDQYFRDQYDAWAYSIHHDLTQLLLSDHLFFEDQCGHLTNSPFITTW